ncbi:Hypothetical predicted protein [Podarcis lilfordi]|uniref:Uncharacterized protein n=1 Tax=Podarcis lilfordi TaxID=74358 RepID=A0AA35L190_9SAUR|nr:Hypothetical predicted protein [Podarcis lilfordi]
MSHGGQSQLQVGPASPIIATGRSGPGFVGASKQPAATYLLLFLKDISFLDCVILKLQRSKGENKPAKNA